MINNYYNMIYFDFYFILITQLEAVFKALMMSGNDIQTQSTVPHHLPFKQKVTFISQPPLEI